jgi:hypothetical protein
MTFYTNDEVTTPGDPAREVEESNGVVASKVTLKRAVIFAGAGLELGFEEPEETLKSNDQNEKEKA